jgi:hypothetical protein
MRVIEIASVTLVAGCAAGARASPQAPDVAAHEMPYKLAIDTRLSAETATQDVEDGFRLAFWAKEHWLGELERPLEAAHPTLLGLARLAELVLVDIPVASEVTVLPHEVFGHGARIREFGGTATYHFEWPPPYSLTPSTTHIATPVTASTPDTQTLIWQAGIAVEGYEAHAAMVAAFSANTLNRIDSGLLVGIPIHEVFEATLPWATNDVSLWSSLQASRYGVSARSIQRRYLAATIVSTLLNPTFLYSCYSGFWRFLALGERTGSLPSLTVGPTALWADPHVSPVPWGLEYELAVLARWPSGRVLELAPRLGLGPGGTSAGVRVDAIGVRVATQLVAAAGVDLWVQPELAVDPVPLFAATRASTAFGARLHAEVRWDQPGWFVGLRLGGKTRGESGLEPIAPTAEGVAFVGLLLGRP